MKQPIIITIFATFVALSVQANNTITELNTNTVHNLVQEAKASTPSSHHTVESNSYTGQDAIDMLGDQFNNVAATLHYDPATLKHRLLTDSTYRIDKNGKLFVAEEIPSNKSLYSQNTLSTMPFNGNPYTLHSKKGSSKVIYIDTNGFNPVGTVWGSVNYKVKNFIKWKSTPSDIYTVWTLIAKTFEAFDVDVTTEEPSNESLIKSSTDDANYGIRVVITDMPLGEVCYCGGLAYVGVVNNIVEPPSTINEYEPALVFTDGLGYDTMAIAAVSAHEIGHNLGLLHDGINDQDYYQGKSVWGPIMGAPYTANYTQWSKGDYEGATNHEDDISIINQNFPTRADDVPNDFDNAPALEQSGLNIKQFTGIIESERDRDMFTFVTNGGDVTFTIGVPIIHTHSMWTDDAIVRSTILNTRLTIYDENKTVVMTHLGELNAQYNHTITANLLKGKYYLMIQGDELIYRDTQLFPAYSSIGQYSLTGSFTPVVDATSPVANIDSNITEGTGPLSVTFTANGSIPGYGSKLSYTWSFDDGSPIVHDETVTHEFRMTGDRIVTLTVMNDASLVSTITKHIMVNAPLTNLAIIKSMTMSVGSVGKVSIKVSSPGIKTVIVCGNFEGNYATFGNDEDITKYVSCGNTKNGSVSFTTPFNLSGKHGTLGFKVTSIDNVDHTVVYDAAHSKVTSKYITK